jgi:hypothetical protein
MACGQQIWQYHTIPIPAYGTNQLLQLVPKPEKGLVKPARRDKRALSPTGMLEGKAAPLSGAGT